MDKNQRAWLIAEVPTKDKTSIESIVYITNSFEEVFKFRRIAKLKGITHSVRFKQVDLNDRAHYVNNEIKESVKSKLKKFFTRPIFK